MIIIIIVIIHCVFKGFFIIDSDIINLMTEIGFIRYIFETGQHLRYLI